MFKYTARSYQYVLLTVDTNEAEEGAAQQSGRGSERKIWVEHVCLLAVRSC